MSDTKPTVEQLNTIVVRLRAEYANDPNITHVFWGLARRRNETQRETAIIFQVKEKLRTDAQIASAGTRRIPDRIDGIPTDVQAQVHTPANGLLPTRDDIADPLNGGWLTATYSGHTFWWGDTGGGTIGALCRDNATGDTMGLSNWHVWGDGFETGDNILQPSTPTAGGYVEGTVKVAACGPLVTSLIEWEWPDPLTGALYGGAAAAAVAAGLSDHRDPTRRGQDATAVIPGERTLSERVDVSLEYPDLPFPGRPFRTEANWKYSRLTDITTHGHAVQETLVNPQFLFGKRVVTDEPAYQPGRSVVIRAAILDYQPRPCDAYFVVAHVIPDRQPQQAYRVVLHPSTCDRFPEPQPEGTCLDFAPFKAQSLGSVQTFDWLTASALDKQPLRIVDWYADEGHVGAGELAIRERGVVFTHAPASEVSVEIVRFNERPVSMVAFDAAGNVLGRVTSQAAQSQRERLRIAAEPIARTVLSAGAGEGVLLEYCIRPARATHPEMTISQAVLEGLERAHVPTLSRRLAVRQQTKRCCFSGVLRLPPHAEPGRWKVYVFVQNVNHVPEGTPPDVAATVIGGHMVSAGSPQVLGCVGVMLFDHVFDVI